MVTSSLLLWQNMFADIFFFQFSPSKQVAFLAAHTCLHGLEMDTGKSSTLEQEKSCVSVWGHVHYKATLLLFSYMRIAHELEVKGQHVAVGVHRDLNTQGAFLLRIHN